VEVLVLVVLDVDVEVVDEVDVEVVVVLEVDVEVLDVLEVEVVDVIEVDVEVVDELEVEVVDVLDVDVVVDDDDDVDVVLVELVEVDDEVLVLVEVVVVVGVSTRATMRATQSSINPSRVGASSGISQSLGFLASSFSKHPLLGSSPPSNFRRTLSLQPLALGSSGFPGVWASWWHLRRPFSFVETHLFFPAPHLLCVRGGGSSVVTKAPTHEAAMSSIRKVSSNVMQSLGILASSFSTQPLSGAGPPSNFSRALSMQPLKLGSIERPGVSASWWHLRSPVTCFAAHLFLPARHFDCRADASCGSTIIATSTHRATANRFAILVPSLVPLWRMAAPAVNALRGDATSFHGSETGSST
jgi:hypothetical protein